MSRFFSKKSWQFLLSMFLNSKPTTSSECDISVRVIIANIIELCWSWYFGKSSKLSQVKKALTEMQQKEMILSDKNNLYCNIKCYYNNLTSPYMIPNTCFCSVIDSQKVERWIFEEYWRARPDAFKKHKATYKW